MRFTSIAWLCSVKNDFHCCPMARYCTGWPGICDMKDNGVVVHTVRHDDCQDEVGSPSLICQGMYQEIVFIRNSLCPVTRKQKNISTH